MVDESDEDSLPKLGWEDQARCKGLPTEWFYPAQGRRPIDLARIEVVCTLCSTCPVKTDCLNAALQNHEDHGIWGGLTKVGRDKLYTKVPVSSVDEEGNTYSQVKEIPKDEVQVRQAQLDNLYSRRRLYKRNVLNHQWLYENEPHFRKAREIIDEYYKYETPSTPTEVLTRPVAVPEVFPIYPMILEQESVLGQEQTAM